MTASRWLGIAVATLVWAVATWLGFLSLGFDRGIGIAILAVGMAFAMYTLAGFSGASDIGTTGFRAALVALGVSLVLVLAYWGSDIDSLIVAAPVLGPGLGGAYALTPNDEGPRLGARAVGVLIAAIAMIWVYWVDHTVYGLVAPLVTFAPLGIADRIVDRAREVLDESA